MPIFEKSVLSRGLRIVTEAHPTAKSVAMGLFVAVGTRNEKPNEVGVSHLLEHLVFKGTKTRTAYDIAFALESLGGDLNAYTTREYTCFHSLCLKENWRTSLEILSDLAVNMKIKAQELSLEKSVILHEIASSEDTPEDWIYDEFFKVSFPGQGLGRTILGEIKTLAKLSSRQIMNHYKSSYCGSRLVLAATGAVDHREFVNFAEDCFSQLKPGKSVLAPSPSRWKAARVTKDKDCEQAHLLLGFSAPDFYSKDRFCAFILNALLGGGMTSRLYQSVREKRGLAYTVYSSYQSFLDAGFVSIYAATEPSKLRGLLSLIEREVKKLRESGIKKSQLDLYKTQIRGSLILGSDDMENRLSSIGVNELVFGEYRSVDSIIEEVEGVTVERFNEFIGESLEARRFNAVLVGPEVTKSQGLLENFGRE